MGIIPQFESDKGLSKGTRWGLKTLSELIGKPIPKVSEIKEDTFGYTTYTEDCTTHCTIGLGLYNQDFSQKISLKLEMLFREGALIINILNISRCKGLENFLSFLRDYDPLEVLYMNYCDAYLDFYTLKSLNLKHLGIKGIPLTEKQKRKFIDTAEFTVDMSDLESDIILTDIFNKKLSQRDGVKKLLSIIELNDSVHERARAIEVIDQLQLKDSEASHLIENCLISDESSVVRAAAAKYIVNNCLESRKKQLKWALHDDTSNIFIVSLYNALKDNEQASATFLLSDVIRKYAKTNGIKRKEAIFFLDLESEVLKNEKSLSNYDHDNTIHSFKNTNVLYIDNQPVEIYHIPKSIKYLRKLRRIKLTNLGIKPIPSEIGRLKYLESLILYNNNIESVPDTIGSLNRLEKLDLRSNQISKLPESIGKLSSLRSLLISDNTIKTLPDEIKSLENLKDIKI